MSDVQSYDTRMMERMAPDPYMKDGNKNGVSKGAHYSKTLNSVMMNKKQSDALNKIMLGRIFKTNNPEQDAILDRCMDKFPHLKEILEAYPTDTSFIKDAIGYGQEDTNASWERFKKLHPGLDHVNLDEL